jgi:two-component system, OmpR family, sensor histidine kinase VicK
MSKDSGPLEPNRPLPIDPAVTISAKATVRQAIGLLYQQQTSYLAVVEGRQFVGMFVEWDAIRMVALEQPLDEISIASAISASGTTLQVPDLYLDSATSAQLSVLPAELYRAALELCRDRSLRYLPLVDAKGCLLGVLGDRAFLPEVTYPPDQTQLRGNEDPRGEDNDTPNLLEHQLLATHLETYQTQLRAIFAAVRDLVLAIDVGQASIQVLPTRCVLSSDADDIALVAETYNRFFDETAHEFWSPICQALVTGQTIDFEYCLNLGDRSVWMAAHISPLSVGEVLWVAREIGDRICAETILQNFATELEVQLDERTAQLHEVESFLLEEIRERHTSERALKMAKDRLQAAIDAVPGFVSWIGKEDDRSPTLRYQGVNRHLASSFNLSPHDFIGQNVGFIEGPSEFTEFLVQFMSQDLQSDSRVVDLMLKGKTCSYLIAVQKYQRNQAAVSVGIDITDRKKAEESLRYQLAFEKLVMSISTDFINLKSEEIDGGIRRALQSIGEFSGVDYSYVFLFNEDGTHLNLTHEWTTLGIEDCISSLRDRLSEILPDAMSKLKLGEALCLQSSDRLSADDFVELDGSIASLVAVPITYRGYVMGFTGLSAVRTPKTWSSSQMSLLRIVAELFTSTLQRQLAERELRQSERKFRAIFDQAFQFIGLLEPDGRVIEMNQTALDFSGLTLEEVVGKPCWTTGWGKGSPKIQHQLKQAIAQALQDRLVRCEVEVVGTDDRRLTLDFSLKPVKDETGRVVLLIAEGRDVTDRQLAQQRLQLSYQHTQLLSEVTLKIRQSLKLDDILQTAVAEVQEILGASRVSIVRLRSPHRGVVVKEAVLPGYASLQGCTIADPYFWCENPDSSQLGQLSAITDVRGLTHLQHYDIRARLVVPIFISSTGPPRDRVATPQEERSETSLLLWGFSIAHQCDRTRQWTEFEIDLLGQLADQLGIAITHAQLLDNLEEIVAQRTSELRFANQNLQQEIRDRRRAEGALRRSEQQLRLTADALPVLISYVDAQQYYRFNNRAYESWVGKPLSAITGHHLREVFGEDTYEFFRSYIEEALSGSRVSYEAQLPEINGTSRYVSITYIPDIGEQGEVKGYFGVAIDISDRKAVEQMKDEFLSVASHELRTPLTSIRGSLGLLATGRLGTLSAKGQRMLEIALDNTERLCRLVDDILDLQRMELGQAQTVKQLCNGVELLVRAVEAMQSMADLEGVELLLKLNDRSFSLKNPQHRTLLLEQYSIPICVDPDRILQTLTNLISNAIKFSPMKTNIWLSVSQQDGAVCFQVRDRGRGIPVDKLESIFGRFQQVDASDSRQKGGTGLGLAISRQIVQQHGGCIWAESVLGEGSTFYLTLPMDGEVPSTHNPD